jgi:hypothetical protein
MFLNWLKLAIFLKSSGRSFHKTSRVKTTTYGKSSFKYTAAVLWNDLPDDVRKIANFIQFKNILLSWNGNEWACIQLKLNHSIKIELSFSRTLIKVL